MIFYRRRDIVWAWIAEIVIIALMLAGAAAMVRMIGW